MTQTSNTFSSVLSSKDMDAILAKNKEIVVRCQNHGEFSRADLIKHGVSQIICPVCEAAKQSFFERARRIKTAEHYFRTASGVPARFKYSSFDNYHPGNPQAEKIIATLQKYVAKFSQHRALGLSLILCGKTGTGKTHLSCAVLRALAIDHGVCGKYCTAYRAIQEIRSTYKSSEVTELQVLKEFISPDILVLDEIGVQYGTNSEQLLLFSLLNGRYEELKPTIIISNLNLDEVTQYLGDRVYDRLRENGGGVLTFDWGSWRQKRSKQ